LLGVIVELRDRVVLPVEKAVLEDVMVLVAVLELVIVPEPVFVAELVCVPVAKGVPSAEGVPDTDPDLVSVPDPDPVCVIGGVLEGVRVFVGVPETLSELDAVLEGLAVKVVVEVLDQGVPVCDWVAVLEAVEDRLAVRDAVFVMV